jgi:hypothetical protein
MARQMKWFRLEVFKPREPHQHCRDILATDDREAIKRADELYDGSGIGVALIRYVLYDDDRIVHERVGAKRSSMAQERELRSGREETS